MAIGRTKASPRISKAVPATRYDRLLANFMGFVELAAVATP
jgi:hypothetical protein